MTVIEVIQTVLDVISWGMGGGIILGLAWCAWVYITDLASHSEQTEEDEKRIIESLKEGKGIRASEMGRNCD